MAADEQVAMFLRGQGVNMRKVRGAAVASRTRSQLVFGNRAVGEIVWRFDLHNRIQIRVIDPALRARCISGVFRANDPESFVALIETVAKTQAVRPGGDVVTRGLPAKNGGGPQR